MTETRIEKITKDIETYKNAIECAEGALMEAERELQEELEKSYSEEVCGYPG